MIEKLDLAGYFLIVWDIVRFCQRENDPRAGARLGRQQRRLLRALDHGGRPGEDGAALRALPLGGARRVARHRPRPARRATSARRSSSTSTRSTARTAPAMTANVITYRDRSAAREVGKALGYSPEQVDSALEAARRLELRRDPRAARRARRRRSARRASTRRTRRARHFLRLFLQIQNLPRHLGQHSGGMVVAAGRLDEVVPLEPAVDAGARRRAVGQGRLRGPRDRQGGPARPRDARARSRRRSR